MQHPIYFYARLSQEQNQSILKLTVFKKSVSVKQENENGFIACKILSWIHKMQTKTTSWLQ